MKLEQNCNLVKSCVAKELLMAEVLFTAGDNFINSYIVINNMNVAAEVLQSFLNDL